MQKLHLPPRSTNHLLQFVKCSSTRPVALHVLVRHVWVLPVISDVELLSRVDERPPRRSGLAALRSTGRPPPMTFMGVNRHLRGLSCCLIHRSGDLIHASDLLLINLPLNLPGSRASTFPPSSPPMLSPSLSRPSSNLPPWRAHASGWCRA